MAAKLTKGFTWVTGSTVNSANLDTHIASATLAGVARDNVDQTDGFVLTVAAQPPPSQAALEPWSHEDVFWPMSLVGTDQKTLRAGAETIRHVSGASESLLAGDLVQLVGISAGGDLTVRKAISPYKVYGVAVMDIAAAGNGVIVKTGVAAVKVVSAVSAGDALHLSSTDGQGETLTGGLGPEKIGIVLIGAGSGGFAWTAIQR